MISWLSGGFGNPSGAHQVARQARRAVDEARDLLADFLGVEPGGIVFTSGGTEADNLAVLGPLADRPGAVVTTTVEHPAVREAARASGREVRMVPVGPDGLVDMDGLDRALEGPVAVVSVQLVNHETGVVQPFGRIARRVRRRAPGAVLHTDAVQAAGWIDLGQAAAAADLVTVSGHKIGGPQGVGVLAVRGDVRLSPVLHGGGQERERRSGTHNVAAIVGLAAAVAALGPPEARAGRAAEVAGRRDRLAELVTQLVPEAQRTAAASPLAPGHCHFTFAGVESEALLFLLDREGVCASAGAACASGAVEPSPVLLAMGADRARAGSALRLTLGPGTTDEDVERAAAAVGTAVFALAGRDRLDRRQPASPDGAAHSPSPVSHLPATGEVPV